MAIQKTIQLPTGDTGNYINITYLRLDILTKEASAHFTLYKNKDIRDTANSVPQLPIIAKIRLNGLLFDKYLSNDAITASSSKNYIGQLYLAAKTEIGSVISDYHSKDSPLFSNSQDI